MPTDFFDKKALQSFLMDKSESKYLLKLGQKIEAAYREKYPNLSAFSEEVGCDNRTIRRIVRGEQNVTILLLKKIAKALKIPVQELITIEGA